MILHVYIFFSVSCSYFFFIRWPAKLWNIFGEFRSLTLYTANRFYLQYQNKNGASWKKKEEKKQKQKQLHVLNEKFYIIYLLELYTNNTENKTILCTQFAWEKSGSNLNLIFRKNFDLNHVANLISRKRKKEINYLSKYDCFFFGRQIKLCY